MQHDAEERKASFFDVNALDPETTTGRMVEALEGEGWEVKRAQSATEPLIEVPNPVPANFAIAEFVLSDELDECSEPMFYIQYQVICLWDSAWFHNIRFGSSGSLLSTGAVQAGSVLSIKDANWLLDERLRSAERIKKKMKACLA